MSTRISRVSRGIVFASLFTLGAWVAPALAEPKVLATVDGVPVTTDDVADAMADIGPGLPEKLEGAEREKYVLDYLVDLKLVAKKAYTDKLDASPDYARHLAYYKDKLAMEAMMGSVAKAAATEDAAKKAYDAAAAAQPPEPEIHARHILLATEDDAKKALARVKAGEDFAKVATELSKDPAGDGGDLGWFTKDKMVPEFSEAAFKLDAGQISDPVKSQFGWHIIKVEEKRMKTFPPYDQLKEQAMRYVSQKAQSELIADLRSKAKIEMVQIKPAEAPATPAASPAPAPAATDAPKKP